MSLLQNYSYKLSKNQGITLNVFLFLFIILSILWFLMDWFEYKFPIEPIVVLIGGIATLFASYWPWKVRYTSKPLKGRVYIDYGSNNGLYNIGTNDNLFTLKFTGASGESIHMYDYPDNIDSIALAESVEDPTEIRDASVFDFSNRIVSPKENQIVILKNSKGNYAIIRIHDIKSKQHGDNRNEILFSYIINPDKNSDFSIER
jgi:hypothetical protein